MDKKYLTSILLMTISSLSFAIMSLMVRLSGELPLFEKVLFRNLISLIIALLIILKNRQSLLGSPGNRKYLILRGITGLAGVMLYFYSLQHLKISDATMLNKLSPFFVIVFASLFLKERMNRYQAGAIAVAFFASLLIIKPHFEVSLLPALMGMGSALFAGFAYAVIRLLKMRGESSGTIVFYFSFISLVITLPLALADFIVPTPAQFLYLLGIGVFAAFGQLFMTQAYFLCPCLGYRPLQVSSRAFCRSDRNFVSGRNDRSLQYNREPDHRPGFYLPV